MTVAQAREAFLETAHRAIFSPRDDAHDEALPVTGVRLSSGGLRAFVHTASSSCILSFRKVQYPITVETPLSIYRISWAKYQVGGLGEAHFGGCDDWHFVQLEDAQRFANAVYVLSRATPDELAEGEKTAAAAFEETVRQYQARAIKPELSEEARRHKIQAESAIKEKLYERAIDLYAKSLSLAPWWPEGHFNRALILAEVRDYFNAIDEMKKYLQLEPQAPNARAAQDKIYAWEGEEAQ